MSDTSQGADWWLASDGKWYPPELWTGPPEARPGGAAPQDAGPSATISDPSSGSGSPSTPPRPGTPGTAGGYGTPVYGTPGYGEPESPGGAPTPGAYPAGRAYPAYGHGQPAPYPMATGTTTNSFAVAALICGIAGFLFFIPAILGVIFGFVARSQIRQSQGSQSGAGMALAGIIIGFAWLALLVVVIVSSALSTNTNTGVVLRHLAFTGGLST